ncbi:MAG: hypothetical protein SGBAC_007994 [Bacillariaceae sp.]
MQDIKLRANSMGWNDEEGFFYVTSEKGGRKISILRIYGSISLECIQEHELTYCTGGTRKAQDDHMLFEANMNSMSATGRDKLTLHSSDYKIQAIWISLNARGERTLDLLTHLFKAYSACDDEAFTKYINDLPNDHRMGTKALKAKEMLMSMQATINKLKDMLHTKKQERVKKEKERDKPDWITKSMAQLDVKSVRELNDKKWNWCCKETGRHCGGQWGVHNPRKCDPNKFKQNNGDRKKPRFGKHANKLPIKQTMIDDEDNESEAGYDATYAD